MEINAFFDASFYPTRQRGVIAIFIKDIESNTVILNKTDLIKCKSSSQSEFNALYKLIKYLNSKQEQAQISKGIIINIFGDNDEVITFANTSKKFKSLNEQLATALNEAFETLKSNNNVTLMRISRKNNSAHRLLTKFKFVIKSFNHSRYLLK